MLSIEPTFLDSYAGPNVRNRVLLFRDKVSYNAGLRYNFSDSFPCARCFLERAHPCSLWGKPVPVQSL